MIASREVLQAAESLPSAPPTERDLEIFAAVRVDCRRQVDVAAEFGISQSRVSQIARDVQEWRVGMGVNADLETRDRKMFEGWLDGQRLENLYEHTLELYRRSCQPKRRERKGANQHGEWHAETIDHPPGNLQCLRLAAQLLELRWKMDEKCPQPSPHALAHADESTFINRLISMRTWAEHRGEVPRGEEPGRLVKRLLAELLGRREMYPADDPPASTECGVRASAECGLRNAESQGEAPAGEPGAHTTHIISAAPTPYEPAVAADGSDVNDCQEATWDEATEAGGEASGEEEKSGADMSGGQGPGVRGQEPGVRKQVPGASTSGKRDLDEEERLALAELRRTMSPEIWPSLANHWVTNLLAEGPATLISKGYTREQRQALLGWQRVMDLRERGRGARAGG